MRHIIITAAALAAWALLNLAASRAQATPLESCVFERDPVTVTGEIRRKRVADVSTHYDETARSRKETIVVLKLSKTLCVMLPDDVNMAPRPRHVHTLQLLADERLPRSSDKMRQVEGTLLLAQSSDHHLPVLLEVKQVLDKQADKLGDDGPSKGSSRSPSRLSAKLSAREH